MELVPKYFDGLKDYQLEQFDQLGGLYKDWNSKINVVSRKDIDQIYLHHVLHSLSIAKFIKFRKATEVLDLGTGGGFPGIPLAIMYPECRFHLIDGTAKKIKVVKAIAGELGLDNLSADQKRAEEHKEKYDYVVNRAVASIEKVWAWSKPLIRRNGKNGMPNGLISLKGGNLNEEIKLMPKGNYVEIVSISDYFSESYFQEKSIVYVQR